MATYRRLESGGNGIWKPKDPGSSIEGVFQGRELGEYGQLLLFQGQDGVPWKVPMTSRLEQIEGQLQKGVTYKLTFKGSIAIAGGKTVKDIVVEERVDEDDQAKASARASRKSPF
jgi:hypothetical protein